MTRVLAGPFSGMLLADMGAHVIKIETPEHGDDSRSFAPFINGESAYYMNLNRNKQGITLNLKDPDGVALFLRLVAKADILIENFRPNTMEKLGIGYEKLKEINPRLVYGCVSGFGHYGPYSARAGYDIIGRAMGGLMSTTGWPDGEPTRCGTAISDVLAGMFMTIGVPPPTTVPRSPVRGRRSMSRWSIRWSPVWRSSIRSTSAADSCRGATATATSPFIPTTRLSVRMAAW